MTVGQILCRLFHGQRVDCPFRRVDDLLRETDGRHPIILDLHGEATSEKIAMGWYLDGRVIGGDRNAYARAHRR